MTTSAANQRLSEFIREHQRAIVDEWTTRVRSLSPARELSRSAIVDHLPQILDRIADLVESVHTVKPVSLGSYPLAHAIDRLARGFDLDLIVVEYGLLRRSILDLWKIRVGSAIDVEELRNLDVAFDHAVGDAVLRYAHARERLLKAIDRVSEAALRSADVDGFLQDLLRATLEGTEAADTCVVLLRENDTLRVRAAVGLDEELRRGHTIRLGEGFAGLVAVERRPIELHHAAEDPVVKSPLIREKGVRALYGVPMVREDKTIGVALVGSVTALEFSEEDKLLFRTMVNRATSGVVKAQLLADVRRAETAQRFLAEASRCLAESLDYEQAFDRIARLAVPAIADGCLVDLVDDGQRRRVSVAHVDPAKEQLVRELRIPKVVRTGLPEWSPEIPASLLESAARDDEHRRMLHSLGLKSYIIVPIVVRLEAVGAIALVTAESGRRYSESDLRIAEDLASRAAMAMENARLYAEAQKAIGARERVMAVVSHDLRNLVGVVSMAANVVERKIHNVVEAQKPVEIITRTAERMQHLLDDLIDMAAIQAGRTAFERRPVELKPMLVEACEAEQEVARAKGVRVRTDLPEADVHAVADRKRILQVLTNLLGNAVKFAPADSAVTVGLCIEAHSAVIRVRDEGPGIPADEIDAIFEPYRTIEREGSTGTGLGLYIARSIVERHGGRMWVQSEVGRGATFFFALPLPA